MQVGPGAPDADRAAEMRLIVPCRHNEAVIRTCILHLLAAAKDLEAEIVVVDDSGRPERVATLLRDLPVRILTTGGSGSAAQARNLGAHGATCPYLLFIDADVAVEPASLLRLLRPLRAGLAEATVGNYARDVAGDNFASAFKQLYIAAIYDRRGKTIRNDYWTALAALRTEVFQALGGFDASYRGACGEDGELGIRLTEGGWRIQAVADARGRHLKRFTLRSLVRNDWRKGKIAIRNYLRSQGQLSDNRHASHRDMAAAALSGVVTALPLLALLLPPPWRAFALAAWPALTAAYLVARLDLLRILAGQGPSFLVRAVPTLWLLDQVRLACAAHGLGGHLLARAGRDLLARLPMRHLRHHSPV